MPPRIRSLQMVNIEIRKVGTLAWTWRVEYWLPDDPSRHACIGWTKTWRGANRKVWRFLAGRPQSRRRPTGDPMTTLTVSDNPKMLRETLCVAQTSVGHSGLPRATEYVARLQRLIDECDRHRPIGPNGKHAERHTPTCGCEYTRAASTTGRPAATVREVLAVLGRQR